MIIWFLVTTLKISAWGHVCRHSRIRTYPTITASAQWDVTSLSTDRHTASVVQHSHFLSTLWIQKVLIPSTCYQMCSLSQLKTLWRMELPCRVEPLAGSILRDSSELYCSAQFTVQPGVSNAAGPKYLNLVTEWKERILVVITILFVRSIEYMHHYSHPICNFMRIIAMLVAFE